LAATEAWPVEIGLDRSRRLLRIRFNTGENFELEAEYLRVESPSAEVKGHSASEAVLVTGKEQVLIERLEPVGNYAVRPVFSDGHDSGLYTWSYLARLGRDKEKIWNEYLRQLADTGGSRK
jgi:DUF971 family protein